MKDIGIAKVEQEPKTNTYNREFTNRMKLNQSFDAWDISCAFQLDAFRFAAVKKIIGMGGRNGGKDANQDIDEAIEALVQLKIEMSEG